ncbi:hypothetical protein AB0O07_06735 [Streptomyces sp. NPDC093085]
MSQGLPDLAVFDSDMADAVLALDLTVARPAAAEEQLAARDAAPGEAVE